MDEQKETKIRHISGRLTDTLNEPDTLGEQEMFTPRKVVRQEQKIVPMERPPMERPPRQPSHVPEKISPAPANTGKRRRVQENEARMRTLWGTLGILVILLTAAIIYEVILGHGMKETGSERMAKQEQEEVIVILDEPSQSSTDSTE